MKLKAGEAAHLAGLIVGNMKPQTPALAKELDVWIKRLQGGR